MPMCMYMCTKHTCRHLCACMHNAHVHMHICTCTECPCGHTVQTHNTVMYMHTHPVCAHTQSHVPTQLKKFHKFCCSFKVSPKERGAIEWSSGNLLHHCACHRGYQKGSRCLVFCSGGRIQTQSAQLPLLAPQLILAILGCVG